MQVLWVQSRIHVAAFWLLLARRAVSERPRGLGEVLGKWHRQIFVYCTWDCRRAGLCLNHAVDQSHVCLPHSWSLSLLGSSVSVVMSLPPIHPNVQFSATGACEKGMQHLPCRCTLTDGPVYLPQSCRVPRLGMAECLCIRAGTTPMPSSSAPYMQYKWVAVCQFQLSLCYVYRPVAMWVLKIPQVIISKMQAVRWGNTSLTQCKPRGGLFVPFLMKQRITHKQRQAQQQALRSKS